MRYWIVAFTFLLVVGTFFYFQQTPGIALEAIAKPLLLKNVETHRVYFRDDDIAARNPGLERMVNLFIDKETPIALGVIPLAVDDYYVDHLRNLSAQYPDLIEIDMHAYSHARIGGSADGEFKDRKRVEDVASEVFSGKGLMDQYFETWSHIFTVPFSAADNQLLIALETTGFSGVSMHYPGNRIPEQVIHRPSVLDYSTCVDLVKNWTTIPVVYVNRDEFIELYQTCKKNGKGIGIMLHHHTLIDEQQWELLSWVIDYVKNDTIQVIKMKELYA